MKTLENLKIQAEKKIKEYQGWDDAFNERQVEKWEYRLWKIEFELAKNINNK